MSKNSNRNRQPSLQPTTGDTQTVAVERPAHIDSGEDARGAVNARENQTSTQTEPSPAVTALGDKVISIRAPKTARNSPMELVRAELSEVGQLRHQTQQEARQLAAEAADLMREGGEKAKEGKKLAAKVATLLFTARASNAMDAAQVSSILGDTFGWKATKGDKDVPRKGGDPEAGKTPFGEGEAIRKRVVRAVQAHEFVEGGEPSKFFDGLPKDKVGDILNRVTNNDLSIYSAYDALGDIKRDAASNLNPAFDPVKVAKFAEGLRQPKLAEAFNTNRALVEAYLAVFDLIAEVNNEAAALSSQAA